MQEKKSWKLSSLKDQDYNVSICFGLVESMQKINKRFVNVKNGEHDNLVSNEGKWND